MDIIWSTCTYMIANHFHHWLLAQYDLVLIETLPLSFFLPLSLSLSLSLSLNLSPSVSVSLWWWPPFYLSFEYVWSNWLWIWFVRVFCDSTIHMIINVLYVYYDKTCLFHTVAVYVCHVNSCVHHFWTGKFGFSKRVDWRGWGRGLGFAVSCPRMYRPRKKKRTLTLFFFLCFLLLYQASTNLLHCNVGLGVSVCLCGSWKLDECIFDRQVIAMPLCLLFFFIC